MRIAIFHELPPGGARIATNKIAEELKKRHEVDLYYVDNEENSHEEVNYSNTFFYKFIPKSWQGNNWKIRLFKDTIELFCLYRLHKNIAADIRKRKYDFLLVNASKFIESPFLLRFPNTKKVFYLHDPHDRSLYEKALIKKKHIDIFRRGYDGLNGLIRKILDKQNLAGADFFLANSSFTKKMFNKTYGKESAVAYLGVDAKFFNPKNIKKEIDVLYIGSRQPIDGYSLLEKSLVLIKKKIIIRKVFFEDEWLSGKQLRELYRKSQVVVALGKNEPFGLIPLEAMACAVPVIAVDEGGYKETVIDQETGYLVSRNSMLLADKIALLLSNKLLRMKMGENARISVEKNWKWEKRVQEMENKINLLLND
jgi:glycosyltransferase involved in cell wall biosynthesis